MQPRQSRAMPSCCRMGFVSRLKPLSAIGQRKCLLKFERFTGSSPIPAAVTKLTCKGLFLKPTKVDDCRWKNICSQPLHCETEPKTPTKVSKSSPASVG